MTMESFVDNSGRKSRSILSKYCSKFLKLAPRRQSNLNSFQTLQDGREQQTEEVRLKKTVKAAKWKMAEDGEGGLVMEDEGGVWGWKSPEDGSAAQSSAHPCPPCNR